MRLTKLLLTAVFGLALVGGVAACSTSDDMSGTSGNLDDPADPAPPTEPRGGNASEPVKGDDRKGSGNTDPGPGDNSGDAPDLESALNSHGDTERVALEIIKDDCGTNVTCLEQLQALETYIQDGCGDDGCDPATNNFLKNLTSSQRQGVMPATFPQVRDVKELVDDALSNDEPASGDDEPVGDEPVGDEPANSAANDAVADLVDELRRMSNSGGATDAISFDEIVGLLGNSIDPEIAAEIRDTLEEQFSSAVNDETATKLAEGEKVDPADAADAVENAWSDASNTTAP